MMLPPPTAVWLGDAGLPPFVGLAGASLCFGLLESGRLVQAQLAYGASMLSFMGAVNGGLALHNSAAPNSKLLHWVVVPSLLASVVLLLGAVTGLWRVLVRLGACFAVDRAVYPRLG